MGAMRAWENPFRSERIDALPYRAEGFHWKALESRLAASAGRGAIIGPEGHGKTTLMREWLERYRAQDQEAVLIKLEFRQRRLTPSQRNLMRESPRVFLDSAEQLSWWGWHEARHLTRQTNVFVITSHRAGLLPTLIHCRTSPELLNELIQELNGKNQDCQTLWHQHRGNIRHALRSLYDVAAAE